MLAARKKRSERDERNGKEREKKQRKARNRKEYERVESRPTQSRHQNTKGWAGQCGKWCHSATQLVWGPSSHQGSEMKASFMTETKRPFDWFCTCKRSPSTATQGH